MKGQFVGEGEGTVSYSLFYFIYFFCYGFALRVGLSYRALIKKKKSSVLLDRITREKSICEPENMEESWREVS